MKEEAVFIIKPDGFDRREEIKSEISDWFDITYTAIFDFGESLVAKIYPTDIGKPYYKALIEYMSEKPCELGIIKGDSAIDKFFEIAGKYSDPKKCEKNTLRYRYGRGLDITKSGLTIIKNAVHRVKTREEFEYEKEIFQNNNLIKCQN